MRQVFHIFCKDLRHFWPEACVCVLVTGLFARLYPAQWLPAVSMPLALLDIPLGHASMQTAASIATGLVPLVWFVLVVRLVQDECLVGERPYWFTRPYEWPKLLAAKAAFLAIFAVLPLAVAQWVLLQAAGFHGLRFLPLLLLNVFVNVGTFLLPTLCLATVTQTFLRAALTFFGLCLALGAIAGLSSTYLPSMSIPYNDQITIPMLIAAGTAVVFVQYSARNTWFARSTLVVLVLTLTLMAINPLESYLLEHVYYPPATWQDAQMASLAIANDPARRPSIFREDDKHDDLTLAIDVSGVPYGDLLEADDVRLRITAADGSTITTPWQAFYNHRYAAGTRFGTVSVKVDHAFLTKARAAPVNLELSLAVTALQAGLATQYRFPATGELIVPGFGICAKLSSDTEPASGLHCRYAFRAPPRTLVTAFVSEKPCPEDGSLPHDSFPLIAEAGTLKPDPVDDGLTSVWDAEVPFTYAASTDASLQNLPKTYLCAGTALSFAQYHVLRRARFTLLANGFQLPH